MKRVVQTRYTDELRGEDPEGDEEEDSSVAYLIPKREDVLMGKGRPTNEHHGNMILQSLVDQQLDFYMSCDPVKRPPLFASVVRTIQREFGGQFLSKEHNGIWMEIAEDEAVQKVARTFRVRIRVRSDGSSTPAPSPVTKI